MKGSIAACIVAVVIVLAIVFGPDIHQYFGTRYADADREIFKSTAVYNEGMLDDLAKYKFEYDAAQDKTEKQAIQTLVRNRFANFDKTKVENTELLEFLRECGI